MNSPPRLTLASTSPRRREILDNLGIAFDVVRVATDESRLPEESPSDMVLRLAVNKANAASNCDCVLAADTVVVLRDPVTGDRVLGKPRDAKDAIEMLLSLSGRPHQVLTGVALRSSNGTQSVLSETEVRFREIDRDEALRYWQSGEPTDKAGAYGIQGLGGLFVEAIAGSYSGVMGLPVFETAALLRSAGIDVLTNQR